MIACQAERAEEFLGVISAKFLLRFKDTLKESCGFKPLDWDDEWVWSNLESTVGWVDAFYKTCEELGNLDLKQYYKGLGWEDSDVFDGDVTGLAVRYGVIRPMEITNDDETEVS